MRSLRINKAARRFAALALAAAALAAAAPATAVRAEGQASAAAPYGAIRLPVIMYHGILNDPARQGTYVISERELDSDLKYLRDNGYGTVSTQDLIDYVNDGAPMPEKPVMLTFDDGYYNNYLYAFPLLKKYGMKAVVSIIGKYTDASTLAARDHPAYSHITWSQAAEMASSGFVEIQNHSYDLHTIDTSRTASMRVSGEPIEHYETVLISDTVRLQALIDEHTGRIPTAYAYPYGLISRESVGILREIGIKCSFTACSGMNDITRDPECLYLLKRLLRPHGKSMAVLLEHYE
jgi:peptidoglycan/xylan/chitin deacetylase (PgdA/CDA1 family)